MEKIKNFIAGEFCESKKYLDNFNPALGEAYSQVPDSSPEDLDRAIKAAQNAFPLWQKITGSQRAKYLRRIASLLEKYKDKFALAESNDVGKPLTYSESVDVPRAIRSFEFFADIISQAHTDTYITDEPARALNYTLRQPLGVVGTITPWNLPLYLITWKIAPALAAGNCVVAKPSEVTPMSAYLLSQICQEAELPPGVLNIIHGTGDAIGSRLVGDPRVKAISFTGSTKVGKIIGGACGQALKKVSLELGGKNPNIVFADCDWEKTLSTTVRAAFNNSGQICLCGSRIFIEKSIYEKFKTELVKRVKALNVGDPLDRSTTMGSLVSKPHYEKVLSYFELAKKEGGTILTGGKPADVSGRCQQGWFIEPTLIEGLSANCRTNQEEIFGPVATLIPFETEEEVIAAANSVEYGLSASLWTQDITRAHRVASLIDAGVVWVNSWMIRDLRTPFGGMKQSGVGREGGEEAMRFFTEPKNVCVGL